MGDQTDLDFHSFFGELEVVVVVVVAIPLPSSVVTITTTTTVAWLQEADNDAREEWNLERGREAFLR